MSEMDWIKQAFQYGLPTFLLLAFCWGMWRVLWAVGTFFTPLIREFFDAAKEFLQKNVQFLSKMEVLGDGLLSQQEAQTELMKRHDTLLTSTTKKIDEIHQHVVKP